MVAMIARNFVSYCTRKRNLIFICSLLLLSSFLPRDCVLRRRRKMTSVLALKDSIIQGVFDDGETSSRNVSLSTCINCTRRPIRRDLRLTRTISTLRWVRKPAVNSPRQERKLQRPGDYVFLCPTSVENRVCGRDLLIAYVLH